MTERISHEEAGITLQRLAEVPDHMGTQTKRLRAQEQLELLELYRQQQQALEADTVSRAEHEAALARVREAWAKESAAEKNAHRVVEDDLEARLTALQAELATERARAEEAEACAGRLHADYWSRVQALSEQSAELAAASARIGMLEEERGRLLDAFVRRGRNDLTTEEFEGMFHEMLLSPAPQASTEPATWCECGEGFIDPPGAILTTCASCGVARPPAHSIPVEPKASTEQASPSPEVGDINALVSKYMAANGAAQPATGGAEHVHDDLLMGDRLTCGPCWQRENGCPVCHVKYGYGHHHSCPGADPTTAEPQGRPEQAGEYVTRAELVEALRDVGRGDVPHPPFTWLADRLEGK